MTKTTILSKYFLAPLRLCVKLKLHYFTIFLLLLTSLKSFGQYETAIQLYDQKKYQESLTEWNKLLASGASGEELYYNIANTHYRLLQYPEAILFYNKSLKWNPTCEECKQNLKLAQKAAGVISFELPEFILSKIYQSVLLKLQPVSWFALGIILLSIFLFILLFKKNSLWMVKFKAIPYLLVFISIVCFAFAWQRDEIKHRTDEVILMKASGLHLSPDANSESKQELIPGQQLQIKDHLSGWIKVQTKEFDLGWVEENKVEVVGL